MKLLENGRLMRISCPTLLVLLTSAQCQQTAKVWFDKGVALYGLGKYNEVIQACDKAIQLKPDDAEAYNNKGLALDGLNKYDEAIQAYDKAIQLKLDLAEAYYNKGFALYGLG